MFPQKRPGSDQNGGPLEKILCSQSTIEAAMLKQKYKSMEQGWKDRGKLLANKQVEINAANKRMEEMRVQYENQIKQLNTLVSFRVSLSFKDLQ
jgi:hypothetical protein